MLGTPHFGVEISDWSLSRLSSAQDTKISVTCRSVRGFRRELAKLVMRVDFGLCLRRVIIPALSVLYEVKNALYWGYSNVCCYTGRPTERATVAVIIAITTLIISTTATFITSNVLYDHYRHRLKDEQGLLG